MLFRLIPVVLAVGLYPFAHRFAGWMHELNRHRANREERLWLRIAAVSYIATLYIFVWGLAVTIFWLFTGRMIYG